MSLFSLRSVSYDLPGRRLIHDLTLTLEPGCVTALIGRNGSGKSTLLKLLAGQIRPAAGEIRYRDRLLADWPRRDLARDMAYLPQVTPPAEGMRLRELVSLGRYPWHGALGRFRPEDHAATERAMARCGLAGLEERLVDTLSGGERQRGWLAMMIAQGAECLLLDEPTSALDIAHQVEVLGLVRGMSRETGLAAVIVLHDVNMAAQYADRVVAMKGGHLVLNGPVESLLQPEALQLVYDLPMQLHAAGEQRLAWPVRERDAPG